MEAHPGFHAKAFDAGTLQKLRIFELYTQEWIPVFVAQAEPRFPELHIFDPFCGPGTDAAGNLGSPLLILRQLREYQARGLAGWGKVKITVHFTDKSPRKVAQLRARLQDPEWNIPGVRVDIEAASFDATLARHQPILADHLVPKLLIIDQFGVEAVNEAVFKQLTAWPRSDFIFFVSSATLNRFRHHDAIKIKIRELKDTYHVHRAAYEWYRQRIPPDYFLSKFSIKKNANIYGLIFGSKHPLGIHKFLEVAWATDGIAGEANFDIERENRQPDEMLFNLPELQPKKVQTFEHDLETNLLGSCIRDEADLIRFCINSGMTCKHATPTLQKLRQSGKLVSGFRVPNIRNFKKPREIVIRP